MSKRVLKSLIAERRVHCDRSPKLVERLIVPVYLTATFVGSEPQLRATASGCVSLGHTEAESWRRAGIPELGVHGLLLLSSFGKNYGTHGSPLEPKNLYLQLSSSRRSGLLCSIPAGILVSAAALSEIRNARSKGQECRQHGIARYYLIIWKLFPKDLNHTSTKDHVFLHG